jgi:hypothetical protein
MTSPKCTNGASSKNRLRNQISALISGVSTEPRWPSQDSGQADPSDETKKSTPATIRPPRRPRKCAMTPPSAPPIKQPQSAPAIVKPSRLSRAPSVRPMGATKFSLMDSVAPEMTAES